MDFYKEKINRKVNCNLALSRELLVVYPKDIQKYSSIEELVRGNIKKER